ncbi:uncharacterized protein LOC127643839 isoform X2 [Xyrauchen texanus]|uniref:uncharacterized protein LOC127643839 isoform X2 n=1 Tax=Xyrauchen texanus TaxID=154827 RepID=UPI0022421A35|nr:uncharacterized protein LOC127643839 isoform X2 [Xyrauchen texanus]
MSDTRLRRHRDKHWGQKLKRTMWFVVALSCAVVAAQPSDRDLWDEVNPVNADRYFPRPVSGKPIRPIFERNRFGILTVPAQMNPWNPDGPSAEPTQDSVGLTFPGQNGREDRGEEFEWTRPGSSLNQGTWRNRQLDRWGGTGKPQKSFRSGRNRPPFRPDRMPLHPSHAPVGSDNQMDQMFGRPLNPNMMDNRQFLPVFRAENVTVQGRGQMQTSKGGVHRPQEMGYGQSGYSLYGPQPYVKLIYNPTATQKISFEYGITQLLPSFMKAESESDYGSK